MRERFAAVLFRLSMLLGRGTERRGGVLTGGGGRGGGYERVYRYLSEARWSLGTAHSELEFWRKNANYHQE